jgi:hypothetical protein
MKARRRIAILVVAFGGVLILAALISSHFDPTTEAVKTMITRELPIGSSEQAAGDFLTRHRFMESWPGANPDAAPTVHVGPHGPEMWGLVEYRTYLWLLPQETGVILRFSRTGQLTSYKVEAVGMAP